MCVAYKSTSTSTMYYYTRYPAVTTTCVPVVQVLTVVHSNTLSTCRTCSLACALYSELLESTWYKYLVESEREKDAATEISQQTLVIAFTVLEYKYTVPVRWAGGSYAVCKGALVL